MNTLYEATATTIGGRNGHGKTPDRKLDLTFNVPPEMGGKGGKGVTPEQLLALAYSACFGSAVHHVTSLRKKRLSEIAVTARVGVNRKNGGGFSFEITLEVRLPELPQAEAEEVAAEAHKICPFSDAFRNNVPVSVRVAGHKA